MNPIILDGKKTAAEINEKLRERSRKMAEEGFPVPVLATILVGDDHSSRVYVKMKANACKRAGIASRIIEMSENSTTEEVLAAIDGLNRDDKVTGILLQHPVPTQVDEAACFNSISPDKDVDGVNNLSFARTAMGQETFKSSTPLGIMKLLKAYHIPLQGKHVVVVGRSAILGKPLAMLMLNENATVTLCHSRTQNIKELTRQADILCVGIGKAKMVDSRWIKEGAVVVDAGYNPGNVGDTDIEELHPRTSAYTPVPGGVGPMTIITLIEQTIEAGERRNSAGSGTPRR
ncbi:MAG: bifunctional methylenetetrahydrofolate dehydrogenase/methenyltetrahydrofolate cyclohydrolase [Spirochaetales bacterium]|nr:bifunctional methylenetetrahydrofolate dehydrogenase/methenyltetrahydrofolate cyclohydrolase [Spirochaetales bacterium]